MIGFFEQVYRLVRQVPPGKVTSYGAIARMLGYPRAARTVGWALRALAGNDAPSGEPVPWHRVVNSRGRISLSEWEGSGLQRVLLEAEGVEFCVDGSVDMRRFGWAGLAWPEVEALLAQRGG